MQIHGFHLFITFLTLYIRGINDIRLISRPIHALSHELEDTYSNTLPTKLISKRILIELLGFTQFVGSETIRLF
jgi:hypothetical protein